MGRVVLVCGGRDFKDRNRLYAVLDGLKPGVIVHGGAKGADSLAGEWARDRGVEERVYPANWEKYGKTAGPIRNREMLCSEPIDTVVAFPGGSGTAHMVSLASAKEGVRVLQLAPRPKLVGEPVG